MANIRFLTGQKSDIAKNIEDGKITSGDVIFTSDTDELIFVNQDTEERVIKSKTQDSYVLNGTDIGGLVDGETIPAGTSVDELLKMLTQKAVPVNYVQPTLELEVEDVSPSDLGFKNEIEIPVNVNFIQNDAGALEEIKYFFNEEEVVPTDNIITATLAAGDNTLTAVASYEEGLARANNLGVVAPSGHIEAGEVESATIHFYANYGVYTLTGLDSELSAPTDVENEMTMTICEADPIDNSWVGEFVLPKGADTFYLAVDEVSELARSIELRKVIYTEGKVDLLEDEMLISQRLRSKTGGTGLLYQYTLAAPAPIDMTFRVVAY